MTSNPSASPLPPPESPRKKRGLFGFLFKTALGCTAFSVGVLLALVLLLPTMMGGTIAGSASRMFREKFHGSITVAEANLAWFAGQSVKGVVIRDPDGKEVARASIELPSIVHILRSGKTDIGRVVLEIDADIVQDDAGVTNLQRALEPRVKSTNPPAPSTADAGAFDPIEWLSRLDLDLEVKSKRLSWSDADTRRVGAPFEVRDLLASVKARPAAPLVVHAAGRIVAEEPGALEIDARINGPISSGAAWPFGRIDGEVRVEGFSTAMVDGLANMQGNLKEVLGERFTLRASAKGATSTAGDLELTLVSDRAKIAFEGRFADGALRSGDKPGLVATFPPPRGFLKSYLLARLPAGTEVALDASNAPWKLSAKHFVLPLPPSGATDLVSLQPTLERAELDLDVDLASQLSFQNDATRAASLAVSAGAIRVQLHLAPGTPLSAHLEASLVANTTGKVVVDIAARDAWAKLARGALPIVDARVRATDVSTAAIGALAGEPQRLPAAIGTALDASLEALDVSLDAGVITVHVVGRDDDATVRFDLAAGARVADGVVRIGGEDRLTLRLLGSTQWLEREIAAFAPAGTEIVVNSGASVITVEASDVSVPMPTVKDGDFAAELRARSAGKVHLHISGAKYTDPTLRAAGTSVALQGVDVDAELAAGGKVTLAVRGALEQGNTKGQLALNAATANAWRFADGTPSAQWPPLDARVALDSVPTALVDLFVQQGGLVARALGDKFSIAFDARGASLNGGTLRARIDSPNATVSFAGQLDAGVLRATGEDELRIAAKVPASVVRDEIASVLPADCALTWPRQVADVTLQVRDIAVGVPDFAAGKPFDLAATLATLAARVQLNLVGVGLENAKTRALKLEVGARDLVLDATIAPHAPLALKLAANLTPGSAARLAVDATMPDPFAVLRGVPLQPMDAKVVLTGLDTQSLDALADQDGLLASLLGASLGLSLDARGASTSSGTFSLDATSPTLVMRASTHVDADGLRCVGDEGLDLRITPDAALFDRYVKGVLPAGTRLQLAPEALALTIKVRDVALDLPKPGATAPESTSADAALDAKAVLDRLSKLAMMLEVDLPALVYADAATDAARRPITLRGLHLTSKLAPRELPFARLGGTIVDEPAGEISAEVRALDPLSKLSETQGLDTFRAQIDVHATKVPTAILDVLAQQGGLLVDALGARVEVTLSAPEISKSSGAFSLDVHSELHSIRGEGHIESGTLVVDKVDGLVAVVGLGPVVSQRVVGRLLPTLVNVQKSADASPAKFSIDALRFPLDGDLRKLDGVVRVDLGEVNYSLFPKLAAFFGESASLSAVRFPMLTVPIQKGVAGYQRLPVRIGSREYLFSGTYDIVTDAAQLTANVPINLLGKKVSSELERLREFIDPELTIPLTIRGSLANPSIGLDNDALGRALEDAGKRALGKLGGNLLDDLLKKKKKKD